MLKPTGIKTLLRKRVVCNLYVKIREQRRIIDALQKKSERLWWVRPLFRDREVFGAWYTSIPCMRKTNLSKYYEFFRMTPETFDYLLELVRPHLVMRSRRIPISPGERLAIFLR